MSEKPLVSILNTRAGNLFSLRAAFERLDYQVVIASTPEQVEGDKLVIPGQGNFGSVMKTIDELNWRRYLNEWRDENNLIIGICVGMQIFFESSEEATGSGGLGWLSGKVEKLNFPKKPMVGWAECRFVDASFSNGAAYFVNSYAVRESEQCIASTQYGETFCSAVRANNLIGFQFHPEKSSEYGSQLLYQALSLPRASTI